jgi:hypothetical protein
VSAPRDKPPRGGRNRGDKAGRREAPDCKVAISGSDREATRVATPAKVKDHVASSVKSTVDVDVDKDAMEQLTLSTRRMGLRSPKITPSRGGKESLQPQKLDLDDEVGSQAPLRGQSKSPNRVHGEVGHDGEDFRHYRQAKDSRGSN